MTSFTTPNPKQELREKVRSLENKLNNMNVNEIMDMVTVDYSDLEQLLSDIVKSEVNNAVVTAEDNLDNYWNKKLKKEVNKVLDELKARKTLTFIDGANGEKLLVYTVFVSAIEQVRKEWK